MIKLLSKEIKEFLTKYNLTQEKFSLECDTTQSTINAILQGKRKTVKHQTIEKIKQGMIQIKEILKQGYKL